MVKTDGPMHVFYAVTRSGSIYRISDEFWGPDNWPSVERIYPASLPSDKEVPFRLRDGHTVGITRKRGVVLYDRGKLVEAELVNMFYWGGHTSPVVGLFLDQSEAEACRAAGSQQRWDERWRQQTLAVLDEIGPHHSVFVPSSRLWDGQ